MTITPKETDTMTSESMALSKDIKKAINKYLANREDKNLLMVPTIAVALAHNLLVVAQAADKAMERTDNAEKLLKIVNEFVKTFPKVEAQVAKENGTAH